ncbi:MAG: TIGR04283 family arsenosugar biosynthesis glycosyltransferase [Candidatus Omnitrophota bacterium]
MISIIIPVYNEEECLSKNHAYYRAVSTIGELIFVDGGSTDRTVALAQELGKLISAPKNRSLQLNRGAQAAGFDILLFLHADATIHLEDLKQIVKAVNEDGYLGGCFRQVLDDPGLVYRWIAWTGNVRAKITKVFYGDQAIFVRKDIFEALGGFPEVNLAEDVLFCRKLKGQGKAGILPYPVHCSARRWKRQGIRRTFLLNWRINTALFWNKDLDQLAADYRDVRENTNKE